MDEQSQPTPGAAGGVSAASAGRPRRAPLRGRRRLVRRLGDVLLIAGGLVLAYPFWSAGYAQVLQGRLDNAYRHEQRSFAAVAAAQPRVHKMSRAESVRRLALLYRAHLRSGDPLGRLRIPAIGLDRLILQGVSGHGLDPAGDVPLLRAGPVHYGATALPGLGEPFAMAGHRTTYAAPFYKLDELRPGDFIYVDTPYAHFRYRVAKKTVVVPTDVGVLADRGYALVLTTCTPPYSASHRLVVWGKLDYALPLARATRAQ